MGSFETKLQQIKDDMVDYGTGVGETIDVSEGTINDIHCVTSALMWTGVETYTDNSVKILPHNCNRAKLEEWADMYGISYTDETQTGELRETVLLVYQTQASGANKSGWEYFLKTLQNTIPSLTNWYVRSGTKLDSGGVGLARGVGTVDIVIPYGATADIDEITTACEEFETAGSIDLQVVAAIDQGYDIKVEYYGDTIDTEAVTTEINTIFSSNKPSDKIYDSRIESLFLQYGAKDATMYYKKLGEVNWLTGDITPDKGILNLVSTYKNATIASITIVKLG